MNILILLVRLTWC